MTIEELLECDADTLTKMSDEELLKHFQQYLCVTRPELIVRDKPKAVEARPEPMSEKKKMLLELLAANGVDTGALMKHRNKKK